MVSREVVYARPAPVLELSENKMVARPVLVTGLPRSGTTWLARELVRARWSGLPGREPMNPRAGQFALGGAFDSWAQLDDLTARQRRLLRRCYAGREPRIYGRYGADKLSAPWPWTHTIVKDPFALLSIPAIVGCTGAVPVVVYRHPGAVLASYRRMGWTADAQELARAQGEDIGAPESDVEAMADFWSRAHRRVIDCLSSLASVVLVSHSDVTQGGVAARTAVMLRCGLRPPVHASDNRSAWAPTDEAGDQLHRFERGVTEVTEGWRERLDPSEIELLDAKTGALWSELQNARLRLP